jgi:hypothetical protein
MRLVLAVLVSLGWFDPALANDSEAEIAVGGLALKETDSISLDSEDLYISKEEVKVAYTFTNTTDRDVDTLVAFPLPDQVYDESGEGYLYDMKKNLAFETRVNGLPVSYDVVEQAFAQGSDVTVQITGIGLPLNSSDDPQAFDRAVKALAETVREDLLAEGLVANQGSADDPFFVPAWNLRTSITRRQVFPAHRTVTVEHRYRPLTGGSVGGNLDAAYRGKDWGKAHGRKFCIEDGWYAAFDRALAKRATNAVRAPYTELWIGYVLTSGANWQGPIKDFRLVVDKGKPDHLVSFCASGVKKISPTRFEVRQKNFEPKDDLNILIVEWHEAGEGGRQ